MRRPGGPLFFMSVAHQVPASGIHASVGPRLQDCSLARLLSAAVAQTLGLCCPECWENCRFLFSWSDSVSLSFQWPSGACFALSSAIVNVCAGCTLTPADRYSTKMASEGASGEQPPPVQTLVAAAPGGIDTVRRVYGGKLTSIHAASYFLNIYFSVEPWLSWGKDGETRCASISLKGSGRNSGGQREALGCLWRKRASTPFEPQY